MQENVLITVAIVLAVVGCIMLFVGYIIKGRQGIPAKVGGLSANTITTGPTIYTTTRAAYRSVLPTDDPALRHYRHLTYF